MRMSVRGHPGQQLLDRGHRQLLGVVGQGVGIGHRIDIVLAREPGQVLHEGFGQALEAHLPA